MLEAALEGVKKLLNLVQQHWPDWLLLVILLPVNILAALYLPTYQRYVSQTEITEYLFYPIRSEALPTVYLIIFAGAIPVLIFVTVYVVQRHELDLHNTILGLLFSLQFSWLASNLLRSALGRARPNFAATCFPDGQPVYSSDGNAICTGPSPDVENARRSFPNEDAALAFSGLGYLSLFLVYKFGIFGRQSHPWACVLSMLPLLTAALLSVAPFNSYQCHWEDTVAGLVIGVAIALLCFSNHFSFTTGKPVAFPFSRLAVSRSELDLRRGIEIKEESACPNQDVEQDGMTKQTYGAQPNRSSPRLFRRPSKDKSFAPSVPSEPDLDAPHPNRELASDR